MGCACSKGYRGPPLAHVLYCRLPEGVHSHMLEHVDLKKLSRLIKSGRLAPLYPHELEQADTAEECPICTVTYPSMNTASCCAARVCTECFVYHQTASEPPGRAQCPFCKSTPFAVRYLGSKSEAQLQKEREEEQLWKQAKQRLKTQQDMPLSTDTLTSTATSDAASTPVQQHHQQAQQQFDTALQQQQQHHHQQQQQQQQQQHRRQHSWLDDLSSPQASSSSSSRRVEAISVYAGYHHRASSSSGGSGPDTGTVQDPAAAAEAAQNSALDGTLGLQEQLADEQQQEQAWRASQVLELQMQQQQQQQQEQEQEQEWRARQVLELQMQQLSELQQLHEAGLLPGYAAAELSGLGLEELDEILLEQAVMESMQAGAADADDSHTVHC